MRFLRITTSQWKNRLKASIEVYFINKSKIFLVHFYKTYNANLWEKFRISSFYQKKNRHSWRLNNSNKNFLNQWKFIASFKLRMVVRYCTVFNFLLKYNCFRQKKETRKRGVPLLQITWSCFDQSILWIKSRC